MVSKKPRVIFDFNLPLDAWNYYDTANTRKGWGYDFTKTLRPEVFKRIKGKKWEEVESYLTSMLKKGYAQNKKKNEDILAGIQDSWRKIEDKYFKRLAKITKHKIYRDEFHAYASTIGCCPYNPREHWLMINLFWKGDYNMIIAHELMHLQFHYYFEDELRKTISHAQFQDIKEALTVLLNLEFSDMIKEKDLGYPDHEKLREFMEKEWKKKKDFDLLVKKCVKYIKK